MAGSPCLLSTQVLVLNKNYHPINITNVKRAFTLFYLDHARAVDADYRVIDFMNWTQLQPANNDEVVYTVSQRFRIPRVILLLTYDRLPMGHMRFSRHNVFIRDDHTCQYCLKKPKRSDLNLDHVIPRSRGGRTSWENVVCCCLPCNTKKGKRTPEEAMMPLAKTPFRPRGSQLMHSPIDRMRYQQWRPFLSFLGEDHPHHKFLSAPIDETTKTEFVS